MTAESTNGYSTEEYSTDEEYQKIIAGEGSDDEDATKQAIKMFINADKDGSGSISLKEYIALAKGKSTASTSSIRSAGLDGGLLARLDKLEQKVDDIADMLTKLCDEKMATQKSKRWGR